MIAVGLTEWKKGLLTKGFHINLFDILNNHVLFQPARHSQTDITTYRISASMDHTIYSQLSKGKLSISFLYSDIPLHVFLSFYLRRLLAELRTFHVSLSESQHQPKSFRIGNIFVAKRK